MSFVSRRSKSQSFRKREPESAQDNSDARDEQVTAVWKISSSVKERLLSNAKNNRLRNRQRPAVSVVVGEIETEEVCSGGLFVGTGSKVHPSALINNSTEGLNTRICGSSKASYTSEDIDALLKSQKSIPSTKRWRDRITNGEDETFIPDPSAISAAYELRERRRAEMNEQNTTKELFIPLSCNHPDNGGVEIKRNTESRLVTEEQEDGMDVVDNYEGNRISFISYTPEEEKRKLEGHIRTILEGKQAEAEEDFDATGESWENSQIRRGMRVYQHQKSIPGVKNKKKGVEIPIQAHIRTPEEEIAELEQSIEKMELSVINTKNNVEMLQFDLDKSKRVLESHENDLPIVSTAYEFFQDLNCYVMDLSEFINEKIAKVDKLDQLWMQTIKDEVSETLKNRRELMNLCRHLITNPNAQDVDNALARLEKMKDNLISDDTLSEIDSEREVLINERVLLLKDAKRGFRSSDEVRGKLERWAADYAHLFFTAYGLDCVPGVYELYVKYDLIGYTYDDNIDISNMKWFCQLTGSSLNSSDGGGNSILSNIIIQYVIPWLKSHVDIWDLYNCQQTHFISRVFSQILSVISTSSPAYKELKDYIIDSIVKTVAIQVEKHSAYLEKVSRRLTNVSLFPFADFWTEKIGDLENNIMAWRHSIDQKVLEYIIENQVIPKLSITRG